MVNTRIDTDLSASVQNALQTLLLQIRIEIHEEFCTSSGPSDAGGNPPPRSGDRHQPTSQKSSHMSHGHNNDRHGSDRRGGSDNHRSSNNNYSGSNNRNSGYGRDQRNRGSQQSRGPSEGYSYPVCTYEILHERGDEDTERPDKRQRSGDRHQPTSQQSSQQSRGPSEGYSYPVCTTCGRRHPGECRRAAGTCFKCRQAGHLQKDCKKNTTASTSGQDDKKPGTSGRVFAITEGHAANTSGRGVVIGISRPLSRVVTGATVIITTVMDLTGEVVVTTTAAATTTLAVTTGIPVMDVTRETHS
nr:hypothetical protein [Tanacetum cinerariifolium]